MAPHPLEVSLILSSTFKYLSLEDLKHCRLVCKHFEYETLPFLKRRTAAVSFGCMEQMKTFICLSRKRFNTHNMPITKICLSSNAFTAPNNKLLDDFLQAINPFVESLSVSLDIDSDINHRLPKSINFPKLQKLILVGHNLDSRFRTCPDESNLDKFPEILKDFLCFMPNLSHLALWFDPFCKESLRSIFRVISLHPPRKLVDLELRLPIGDAQLETLRDMKLRLRRMSCDFPRSCFGVDSLKNFLSTQMHSLEYLKIDNYFGDSCYTVEFPTLTNLKTLKIDGRSCSGARSDVKFYNLCYNKQFPSLNKLEIGGCMEWNTCWKAVFPDHVKVSTVQQLKLPKELDPAWIRHMMKIFPNLKKLKLWHSVKNPRLLERVFKNMTNLQELTIAFPTWVQLGTVDHFLVGWSKSEHRTYMRNRLKFPMQSEKSSSPVSEISLAHLQGLRRLTLKGVDDTNAIITDVTVSFVLAKMQNLTEITIGKSKISDEGLRTLRTALPHCKIAIL